MPALYFAADDLSAKVRRIMTGRHFTIGVLAVVIAVSASSPTDGGQERPNGPKASAAAEEPKAYLPQRTPWGDPDLQGTYTNKYEHQTPFERPPGFEGRRVQDVSGAELAAILAKRDQDVIGRAAGVGPPQFRDTLEVTKAGRAWLVVDPPDGQIPPMTPAAKRRLAGDSPAVNARARVASSFSDGPFDSPQDLSLFDRCITRGLPGSMIPFIHGNSYEIVQAPGVVGITYELIHETRVIPLDGRPHVGNPLHLDMGDARGHWEGNTLVVETTNFNQRSAYRNADAASLRIVERFARTSADQIEWTVTVNDPATWTKPWTFAMPLTMNDGEPVLEFACHEGNYAMRNILSGARAAEAGRKP
jgi:hypothetical protein